MLKNISKLCGDLTNEGKLKKKLFIRPRHVQTNTTSTINTKIMQMNTNLLDNYFKVLHIAWTEFLRKCALFEGSEPPSKKRNFVEL